MDRKRDLEIAQSCRMSPIEDIAGKNRHRRAVA